MTRLVVGPFNRVEGDLEVSLEVADGAVAAAYVNSPLYRGFEQILQGKAPEDALVIVPRICGICSVAQSAAATAALADVMGLTPAENGRLASNLVLACENLADHLTHFYLFFMPDFARPAYAAKPWFGAARERFQATVGTGARHMLAARADFMRLMGMLAGKWPHSLALQPGGSSRALQGAEQLQLRRLLREFRAWLEKHLFGCPLEEIAGLDSRSALADWKAARPTASSDFRLFLEIAGELELEALGRATDVFLSYGAYAGAEGHLLPAGLWDGPAGGVLRPLDPAAIAEDVASAWYMDGGDGLHPSRGNTLPMADKPDAYSWCKAPRLGGRVVETGALARQLVAGQPLLVQLVTEQGGSVFGRVLARLMEIARVLPEMERWVGAFEPRAPFCFQGVMPDEGEGSGLVEAARGGLGHWLQIRRGRLHSYQIIAPTTWNFSPRDAAGQPGALEQALVGVPVADGEPAPLAIQHIVRSFDPCMVCTVH